MAEPPNLEDLPQATVAPRKRARISIIWIIPILAALVAIGIAVQRYLSEGPTITLQRGRQFSLTTGDLGSREVGSPIYYRRLQVGQVIGYDLTADGTAIQLKIFIKAPYDKYVFPGTRFWNASGIDVSVGADGVKVHTEPVAALIAGGLAFETPTFEPRTVPAAENQAYTLYHDRTAAMKAADAIATHYVLYFSESLRGLSIGAPVTF